MAVIPTDWLPWLGMAVGAFIVDQVRFGGRYTNMLIDKISGNSFDVWTLRPETHFKGRHCGTAKVEGYTTRINPHGFERDVLQLAFIDDEGNKHIADADDLDIPPQALKRWYIDRFDIGLRSDKLRELQAKVDELNGRLSTANAKSNTAFLNALDFTSTITAKMGEYKKHIGQTTMIAQRSGQGYQIIGGEQGGTEQGGVEQ